MPVRIKSANVHPFILYIGKELKAMDKGPLPIYKPKNSSEPPNIRLIRQLYARTIIGSKSKVQSDKIKPWRCDGQ